MSLNSALIKDITHYFRPSIKSDKQSDGVLRGENLGTSKFVQCDEDSKGYDCDLYLSESDDDLPVVNSKKKSHLVVQIPGLSACGSSQRKRKLKEETSIEVKKNKRQCDSPTVRHWKVTSDSENVEETFYMSPLRLESDSSPEGSPSGSEIRENWENVQFTKTNCPPSGRKSGVKKKANLKERSASHLKTHLKTSEKISQPKTKKMESKKAGNKVVKQRHNVSASQRSAARIVRRACQKRSVDKRVINSSPPIISTSDDVIILSEKLGSGETKKIVIRPSFVKLAPLFLAKEELQKKKFFLQSGAPEIVVRRMKEQKRIEIELEEASEYPSVSHTLQKDSSFPWCLDKNTKLTKKFSWVHVDHIEESERISSISSKTLSLGNISGLPSFLASMLVYLRPPIPSITSPERSPVLSPNEDGLMSHCFCVGVSPDPANGKSHEYSASDVEMFERVHAWLMRSLLPPGVAFKMCVDLTSFLPIPTSSGFHNNHIVAIPSNSLGPLLRKQMLLKLKEEYPSFPVNRRYQMFYQRKKCAGGLHSYGELPVGNVITLDSTSPTRENGKFSHNKVESNGINEMMTPIALRRSRRRNNNDEPTSQAEVKSLADISSDVGGSSVLSINDTAVKATCSSLLSSECWSDIFAPASYMDACSLGRNLKTLDKLKSWLENWARRSSLKGSSRNKKKSGLSDSEEDYSSSIEFCSSDDDDETKENKSLPTNVAILIGSCGSGKTSSVYALAKEMNFKVLEINASSKRSGKYILATVKEATRSYQVMSSGGPSSSASIGSFFKKSSQNKTNDSIERKTLSKDTKSSGKASSAMSLIFVEDVDVVFENEDEGFIGALTSLTTSTKRPVILEVHTSKPLRMGTTNNWLLEEILTESCPHLINFLAKQNRTPLILPFERSRNNMYAEALLRIACLSEGVWVSKKWSETLFKHTAGDFRRAIQEAQFWAGSVARSSVLLDNLSRYPREVTQKGEILDSDSEDVIHRHAPVNLCGCVGKRACSYPYLWMYKDYIQEIWLKLDQIVDTALMAMQNAVYSRSKCDKASDSLNSPGSCEKSVVIGGKITLRDNSIIISPRRGTPLKSSPYEKLSISSGNIKIKTEELSTTDVKCRDLPVRQSQRANKGNRRYIHSLDRHMKFKHEMNSSPISISARRKIEFISENTPERIVKDTSEKLNSLSSGQKSVAERQNFSKKTSIVIFSDYLDLLCTSDVLLKKFNNAGNLEVGQNLVFEMGNLANLINMSMQVSTSEKSREMEAKQAKDSYTAAQYQMILPIVPDYWLLNCPVLAMDVAPHIRETCRILDELTKSGKTRTRLSHRIPTINRIGPTLREALIKTLVDDSNMNALLKVEANPLKNNDE
ncbi:ATPase family AAA domain-containing protein 5 [Hetaerina americana]|uniref:ATPase family AAA domain-containing protein 5 n=1 Tax=Hetaerina americana TaxID=62018 RepID=UPI003A7F5F76